MAGRFWRRAGLVLASSFVLALAWQAQEAEVPSAFAARRHASHVVLAASASGENDPLATVHPTEATAEAAPVPLFFAVLAKQYRVFRAQGRFMPDWQKAVSGAIVRIKGAVMPIDTPPADGKLRRFWLVNPRVILEGCIFCNPPTLADLVYVETDGAPFQVDREKLFTDVVMLDLTGRFSIGRRKTKEGDEYLFRLLPQSDKT